LAFITVSGLSIAAPLRDDPDQAVFSTSAQAL